MFRTVQINKFLLQRDGKGDWKLTFAFADESEHFRDKKLFLIVNHSYPHPTRHLGCILNASESDIAILNEHHDTLGDEPYAVVCDDSQNKDRSNKTATELLGERYRDEGPTHESEFENSQPITEDCIYCSASALI